MQKRDEGGGALVCALLYACCFIPVAKGNYPFSLVLTYFSSAQLKAENVIGALALDNLNSLSENSRYLTQRHAMFWVGHE